MTIKTGIAYNIFQGTELLPYAIKQIREHVDVVIGCVQLKSWTGLEIPDKDLDIAMYLKKQGLIDELIFFTPKYTTPPKAEQADKSEFCRLILKQHNCTHFIISDVDELYKPAQFKAAKDLFINSGKLSSACLMETYYKEPIYKMTPRVEFYVPFMFKMDERKYHLSNPFPVHVDQSRKLTTKPTQILIFKPRQLLMHHYSYVRTDLEEKTLNSANRHKYRQIFDGLAAYHASWKFPQPAKVGVDKLYEVKKVPNYFDIEI